MKKLAQVGKTRQSPGETPEPGPEKASLASLESAEAHDCGGDKESRG